MASNLSFFVSSSMGMRKTYGNPSKGIARMPPRGGGVGREWQETLAFPLGHRWGSEKHIGIQQGDSKPALDGNGKKPLLFLHSTDTTANNIQEFMQGDSQPALGGGVGR